jgi:hypothetical protein
VSGQPEVQPGRLALPEVLVLSHADRTPFKKEALLTDFLPSQKRFTLVGDTGFEIESGTVD